MLWYKSWLETRWRFVIGLALLMCSAAGAVFAYPRVVELMATVPIKVSGPLGDRIREAAALARSYRGFVFASWFRQNLSQLGTLFAVLLGTATFLSTSGGALFTLSLPVSRQRLLGVRAATGLAELFAIIFVPSMVIPLLAPAIGQTYAIGDALVHSACLFVGASLFFMIALLFSTIFGDPWRPLMIALGIAIALAIVDQIHHVSFLGVFQVMSGESWFRDGRLPWVGLMATAAISASIYFGAARNLVRRDF